MSRLTALATLALASLVAAQPMSVLGVAADAADLAAADANTASRTLTSALPAQCLTRVGMKQTECALLLQYWKKPTQPCGAGPAKGAPVVWVPAGCPAREGRRTITRPAGCRIYTDCSLGCKKACDKQPFCEWRGSICVAAAPPATAPTFPPTCSESSCVKSSDCCFGMPCHLGFCTCLSASSRIMTRDRGELALDEVRIGEHVRVVDPATGALSYSPVMFFHKAQRNVTAPTTHIHLANGKAVRLTPEHNVYVRLARDGELVEKMAGDVRAGMWMLTVPEKGAEAAVPTQVERVETVLTKGFFTPITEKGTIVADGALVSCHAKRRSTFRHAVMQPLIWLYKAMGIPGEGQLPAETADHWYTKMTGEVIRLTLGAQFALLGEVSA